MNIFSPILVHDYLSRAATNHPDKEALVCGDQRLTYKQIDQLTDRLAIALCEMGVKCYDRVVVLLDNSVESVISIYGILKAGGVFVVLNGSMKQNKLAYILHDSGARFLITHTDKAEVIKETMSSSDISAKIIWVGNNSNIPDDLTPISLAWEFAVTAEVDSRKSSALLKQNSVIDIDLATLIYTSGSTGEPKGVVSTHSNVVSAARSIIQYLENSEDDIILNVLPLSFDYGLYQIIMAFMFGGTVVLEKSFVFIHDIAKKIAQEQITGFPIVPTILAMILNMRNIRKYDWSSLRYISNTGAALPVDHIQKLRQLFPEVRIFSMFGLTECKRVSYLLPEELDLKPTSVGKAMPNCQVFIVDENGKRLPPNQVGELVIRGSNVMQGYWNAPEITAKNYYPGRYPGERLLYSGDLFRMDEEGCLYFLGRKDDMIKSRGERISPKEVENMLCEIEEVTEAAVIGVPDEILGQAIKAFVVLAPGADLNGNDILKYCADNLESFMVPKWVEFCETLPKTPNGKIDKKALKQLN